jgi:FtsH-binding integral membrane protein
MSTFAFFQRDINWRAIGKMDALKPEIKEHLTKVYSTLALSVLCAAIGSYVSIVTQLFTGTLTIFAVFGLLIWFHMTPSNPPSTRLMILLAFAFFQGCVMAPLITLVAHIDPAIVTTAFLGTTCIFACFSGMSLLAERRSYFYLAGLLSSGLSLLFFMSLFNIFFRSAAIYNVELYLGLMIFCGFVVFDTQLIVEKRFMGDKDFVAHSLELFLDFINIFVRLLIILSKNKKEKKSNNR